MNNDPDTSTGQNPQKEPSKTEDIEISKNDFVDRFVEYLHKILSISNIARFFVALGVLILIFLGYFLYFGVFGLNFNSKRGVLHLSAVFLLIFYGVVFCASIIYRGRLRKIHSDQYSRYKKQQESLIPKLFSSGFLPIASILLVLAVQITVIPNNETVSSKDSSNEKTASNESANTSNSNTGSDSRDIHIPYIIAFTFATSAILLMIGMELSYSAQKHQKGHRWSVLVTTSLILDFVSYLILIVGFQAPATSSSVDNLKAFYVFILGAGSLGSSFFTVTQARTTDEVLGSNIADGDA